MSTKYQVFISSTYTDLIEERKKVLDVLLSADCIPAGMEAFVAQDIEQFEVIKKVIDLCDYYLLIIGKRYGSVNSMTGKSYTEMEYEYAIEKGIPVLAFLIDDSVELPSDKIEHDVVSIEKLKLFKINASKNRLVSIWKTPDELIGQVAISIMKAKIEIKRTGWQRGTSYDEASLRRQIMDLQIENTSLNNELNNARKTIELFTTNTDIAFEDCTIELEYLHAIKNYTIKLNKTLQEIFSVISTEMIDVSVLESSIDNALKISFLSEGYNFHLTDKQLVKRLLNQFKMLGLLQSRWSDSQSKLFWGTTKKGQMVRNEMILIRKPL